VIGAVIRQARQAKGLTQTQLALSSGISQPNISAIEADRRTPSAETLRQLLAGCGFELIASSGDTKIKFLLSEDDVPGDVPPEPVLDVPPATRQRIVVGVLEAAEAAVRSRA
jgi:transcriptional regulator with XRE-family HTH domain